jgi:membrane fusion protein (multidrug efflux system)
MAKKIILTVVASVVVILVLGFLKFLSIQRGMAEGAKFAPPPPAVTTTVASPQTWQPTLSLVGSLRAVNGVDLATDLAGIVKEIAFESGMPVKKGQLLVKLDTQQEEAQLRSAEASRELAKLNLERQKNLLSKSATAKSDYDSALSTFNQAQASVDESKALIARKTIVAPFDGVIGIRQISLGQFLDVGKPVASLQSLDPIYVDFSVPQQQLGKVVVGGKVNLKAAGLDGASFDGEISAINSKVDVATRNILVEGAVANPESKLRAGMFVDVQLALPAEEGVIAIPSSSISYAPYGDSVYLVVSGTNALGQPAKIAQQKFVKLGSTKGDLVTVSRGVQAGDEVVTSGVFKLMPNSPVNVNNEVQPSSEKNPNPPDS